MNYYHIDDSVKKGDARKDSNKKKQKYCFHNSIERVQNEKYIYNLAILVHNIHLYINI